MMSAGKSAASAFAKGFSSVDSMSVDEFAKLKQKYLDIFNDIQKQLAKTTGSSFEKVSVDEKQINKWANEYVNVQQKAFEKIEKEAIKQQQTLNRIREKNLLLMQILIQTLINPSENKAIFSVKCLNIIPVLKNSNNKSQR